MLRFFLLSLILISIASCSRSEVSNNPTAPNLSANEYMRVTIDSAHYSAYNLNESDTYIGSCAGNDQAILMDFNLGNNNVETQRVNLQFDSQGNFFNGIVILSSNFNYGGSFQPTSINVTSRNFHPASNYPSYYFKKDLFQYDPATRLLIAKYKGYFFDNNSAYDRKKVYITIDVKKTMNYQSGNYLSASSPYYCNTTMNEQYWWAPNNPNYNSFSNAGPYQFTFSFAANAMLGDYALNGISTNNVIQLTKYNPVTLQFENYSLSGNVSLTHTEFHGNNSYSFFGTYSFTATNVNNPGDVIICENGSFRYRKTL